MLAQRDLRTGETTVIMKRKLREKDQCAGVLSYGVQLHQVVTTACVLSFQHCVY